MKSKAPLMLIEQMIMLLVFALAAALCLQAFVKSQDISSRNEARDRAVIEAQNVAESLKSGADGRYAYFIPDGGTEPVTVYYDAAWQPAFSQLSHAAPDESASYYLSVIYTESGLDTLSSADISVYTIDDELLFSLPVAWQSEEVSGGE